MKKGSREEGMLSIRDRKAQSGIITTVLIILIVLISVVIVWLVVQGLVKAKSSDVDIEPLLLSAEIENFKLIDDETAEIKIKRKMGGGTVTGVRLIFEDSSGNTYLYENESIILEQLGTYNYVVKNDSLGIVDFTDIEKVDVHYIFEDAGDKKFTQKLDSKTVSSSSGGGPAPCTETCATFGHTYDTYDICGVSTNCGTCATGETCSASGICESIDPCLPDHNTTGCDGYGTNVYWFDNCGAQNDLKEDCGGAGCTGGVCNGDPCPGQSMTDNCILQPTPSGSTSGDCYTGYTGTCSYRCNAGSWSMETSNCSLPASCTAQSMSDNCILSETPSGGTSGTCYTGYTGDCSYSCNDGTWSKVSGNCEAPTAPEVITCDPGYELSGGVCVKKCWSIIQTTGVGTVREGDTRGTGECSSTIPVDNPECGSFLGCPLQCNHGYMQISNTGSGDSCWQDQWIGKTWHTREQWICQQRMSRTKCYGESCTASEYSTSLNGTMDANGNCIKNPTVPTGGGGGDGCFVAGTMIHMANGELQAIEEVELGDLLMGSEGINKVHNKYVIPFEGWLYSINGSNTFVTETHPFMTEEGWKSFAPELTKKETPGLDVSLLEKGDRLITNKGIVTLESFGREWGKTTVYNFNVTNTHDFWADGYLVHNVRTELLLAKIILESKSEQQ